MHYAGSGTILQYSKVIANKAVHIRAHACTISDPYCELLTITCIMKKQLANARSVLYTLSVIQATYDLTHALLMHFMFFI